MVSKCYKGMPSQATKMPVRKRERTKRRIKQERLEADAKDSDVVYCNAEDALFSQVCLLVCVSVRVGNMQGVCVCR